jgi:hypothetical protein
MSNESNKTNAETPRLYAHVLLDRTGSMAACADDAVGGYNTYVSNLPAAACVSLTLFDSGGIDLVRDAVAPPDAALKDREFAPRGMTPLYAIGQTITVAEGRSKGFDRVALVILTDGNENASVKFKRDDVLKLLKDKQEQDGWLVIYLGANQDAWAVGGQFGTVADNSMSIDADRIGVAMDSSARATASYFASESAQLGRQMSGFSREERQKAKKGGR